MFHIGDGDNARSIELKLTKADLADLDQEFPPPKSKKHSRCCKRLPTGLETPAWNKLDTKIKA
jgi:hypothetical protein